MNELNAVTPTQKLLRLQNIKAISTEAPQFEISLNTPTYVFMA
jgi:hypothetical protein